MKILKNTYQGIKNHIGKIAIGTGILGGALFGIGSCIQSIGEEVARRTINGQEVVYEEGRHVGPKYEGPFDTINKMTVVKGDKKYTLIDERRETNINWKSDEEPNFKIDELERIIVENTKTGESEEFWYFGKMSDWDPSTIVERRNKAVFEEGNKMYNDLRTKIRELLRSEYGAQPSPFS